MENSCDLYSGGKSNVLANVILSLSSGFLHLLLDLRAMKWISCNPALAELKPP